MGWDAQDLGKSLGIHKTLGNPRKTLGSPRAHPSGVVSPRVHKKPLGVIIISQFRPQKIACEVMARPVQSRGGRVEEDSTAIRLNAA